MSKNIEVEISGPLSTAKFHEVISFFNQNAIKTTEKHRVIIDYSTFLEGGLKNREKDIRLRITNGTPEIIVKLGTWTSEAKRKELSVLAEHGSFDVLVQVFGELGFKKGVLCIRDSHVYEYKGIEFSLVEIPGHSFHYEAEIMAATNKNTEQLAEQIKTTCQELGLKIFTHDEYFQYIEILNSQANEIFDYANYTDNYFENRFHFDAMKNDG